VRRRWRCAGGSIWFWRAVASLRTVTVSVWIARAFCTNPTNNKTTPPWGTTGIRPEPAIQKTAPGVQKRPLTYAPSKVISACVDGV